MQVEKPRSKVTCKVTRKMLGFLDKLNPERGNHMEEK
jgi:hypothetical protein